MTDECAQTRRLFGFHLSPITNVPSPPLGRRGWLGILHEPLLFCECLDIGTQKLSDLHVDIYCG